MVNFAAGVLQQKRDNLILNLSSGACHCNILALFLHDLSVTTKPRGYLDFETVFGRMARPDHRVTPLLLEL